MQRATRALGENLQALQAADMVINQKDQQMAAMEVSGVLNIAAMLWPCW